MKKLFLFLTAALVSTGMWATDFTVTLDQFRTTPISGLVKIDNSNLSLSGGALQLSSGNKDFVVSTTNENYLIKRIVFTSQKANFSYGGEAIENGDFTPTTPGTSFTINIAASGGTAKITSMSVTLTTALSETLESLVATALADNTYTTSSSVVTITTVGGGINTTSGQEYINLSKSSGERSLTISTPSSYVIKSISLNYYDAIFSRTITASNGTYDKNTYTWTPSTNTNSVKLTFNTGNSEGAKIRRIYVVYASAGYSVTYAENGHGADQEDLNGQFALPDPLPTLSEEGWIFGGWFTDNGTFESPAVAGAPIYENTTLYAKWTEDSSVTKYSVTYDLNGASGDAPTQADVAAGVEITLADAPVWAHHTFDGWLCSIDSKVKAAGSSYTMTAANTTFTAQWTELFAITEGTPANGSVDADLAEAKEGATVTLTATPATDYLFDAWDVYKTGDAETKVSVTDGKFTMPAYAVTVSATFVDDTRTKILYITATNEADTKANDKLYAALKDDYNIHIVGYASSEALTNYALAILHESIGGGNYNATAVAAAKTATIPVLNTKSYFYNSDRWNWGTPNAGKSVKGCTLNSATYQYVSYHPIFAGVTITDGFVEITDEAAEKCMQPVAPASGKEGYILATAPNNDSGNGCAIQEIPAGGFRGATSGKYLLISVSNAKLNALNANGQKLFKNAVAYLLSADAWTPGFIPSGVDNAEVGAKAVKTLKNGLLIIEKNGVRYNMLGERVQ